MCVTYLCGYISQILWDFLHFVTSCNILAIVEVGRQPEPLPLLYWNGDCSPWCARGGGLGDFLASTTLVAEECRDHRHRDCVTFMGVLRIWTQLLMFVCQILYPFTEPPLQPTIQDLTPNLPAFKSTAISSGLISSVSSPAGVPASS